MRNFPASLYIKVLHIFSVLFYEIAPRLNLVAHEYRKYLIGSCGILQFDFYHRSSVGVKSGFPKLIGIHLTETFVSLNIRLISVRIGQFRDIFIPFFIRKGIFRNFFLALSL